MPDFDEFAPHYEAVLEDSIRLSGERPGYFVEYKAAYAAKMLRTDFAGKALDFGCGIGLLSAALLRQFPAAIFHGFDISRSSLGQVPPDLLARGRFTADRQALDCDYDLIVAANVFHHIEPGERQQTVTFLTERLAPGGKMMIFEHNPANPLTRRVVDACPFDRDAVLLPPAESTNYMIQAGLRLVRRDFIVFFPHALAWLRRLEPLLAWCPLGAQYAVVGDRHG